MSPVSTLSTFSAFSTLPVFAVFTALPVISVARIVDFDVRHVLD
jgi:hypothetical protein